MSKVRWGCIKCPYVYEEATGMSINRIPIECPYCGGKIRGKSE